MTDEFSARFIAWLGGFASASIIILLLLWFGTQPDANFRECCESQGAEYQEIGGTGFCHYSDGFITSENCGCDYNHELWVKSLTEQQEGHR